MNRLAAVVVALFVSPSLCLAAAPGWTAPVSSLEASFPCHGNGVADVSQTPAVNASVGEHGGVRIKGPDAGRFFALQDRLIMTFDWDDAQKQVEVGPLTSAPACSFIDEGDEPEPAWIEVPFKSGNSGTLTFKPDVASCQPDPEAAGHYLRQNQYTLEITEGATGDVQRVSWSEQGYYGSQDVCLTASW